MKEKLTRREFIERGIIGVILANSVGCEDINWKKIPDNSWESKSIENYLRVGEGYFNAKVGKKKLRMGEVNLRYITTDKLKEISKDKTIEAHITEPSWCGSCYDECLELGNNAIYLTVNQAKKIGWTGELIPEKVCIREGRIYSKK